MRAPDTILPLRAEALGFAAGGVRILDGVSLTIEAGGPMIVLGPNGAGKSVLLRLLHGLLTPTEGQVAWSGEAASRRRGAELRQLSVRRSRHPFSIVAARDLFRACVDRFGN